MSSDRTVEIQVVDPELLLEAMSTNQTAEAFKRDPETALSYLNRDTARAIAARALMLHDVIEKYHEVVIDLGFVDAEEDIEHPRVSWELIEAAAEVPLRSQRLDNGEYRLDYDVDQLIDKANDLKEAVAGEDELYVASFESPLPESEEDEE